MHHVAERPYLYNGGLCCLAHGLVKISGCLPKKKKERKKRKKERKKEKREKERKKKRKKACVKKYYCINKSVYSVKALRQAVQWLTLLSCGQTLSHQCQQLSGNDIPADECIGTVDVDKSKLCVEMC